MSCIFCKIVTGEIPGKMVYRDEKIVAFHDLNPVAPVHVLIVPVKHIPEIQDLLPGDADIVGHLFAAVPVIARGLGLAKDGYRIVINDKERAGQSVWHLHAHLLGGRDFAWPPG